MASADVKELLKNHPSLSIDHEKKRIKCSYTNHEMPISVQAVENYVKCKKYQKFAKMAAYKLEENEKHIVPSTKKNHLHEMFCMLTLRHIEKTPEAIQRHISGRKYKNALARWKKCKETGEKFVPHVRRKSKLPRSYKALTGDGDDSDDPFGEGREDDRDSDNMSDLYPDEDFKDELNDEEGESADDDDDDEDDDNDDEEEEDSEDESEDDDNDDDPPVSLSNGVTKKKRNMDKESSNEDDDDDGDDNDDDDAGSDYDMSVLNRIAVKVKSERRDNIDNADKSSSSSQPEKRQPSNSKQTGAVTGNSNSSSSSGGKVNAKDKKGKRKRVEEAAAEPKKNNVPQKTVKNEEPKKKKKRKGRFPIK